MTQQQLIGYVKSKQDIEPIIQANVKLLTPAVQHAAIQRHARSIWMLAHIPNFQPTQQTIWFLLKNYTVQSRYELKNLTTQMYIYIAKKDPWGLGYFPDPIPDEAKWFAIKQNPRAMSNLRPTKQMVNYALNLDPELITRIKNPTYQQVAKRKSQLGIRGEQIRNFGKDPKSNQNGRLIVNAVRNMNVSGDEAQKILDLLMNDINDYEEDRLQQLRGLK